MEKRTGPCRRLLEGMARACAFLHRHLVPTASFPVSGGRIAADECENVDGCKMFTGLSADTSALRPVNILHPSTFSHSSAAILPPETGNDAVGTRCRWRNAQARVDAFWKVWRAEYLQLLHARSKWTKSEVNIKKDALVIIVDETLHRHQWSLGRVVEVERSVLS